MECMNKCGNELTGRQKTYCSDKCRKQAGRNSDKPNSDTAQEQTRTSVVRPANFGEPDCECMHCQTNRVNGNRHVINHGAWKPAKELGKKELNRVTLPGDVDYDGVCNDTKYDSRRIKAIA